MSSVYVRRRGKSAVFEACAVPTEDRLELLDRLQDAVAAEREAQVLADFLSSRSGSATVVLVGRDGGWCVEGTSGTPLLRGVSFGATVELGLARATAESWTFMQIRHGQSCVALLATADGQPRELSQSACAVAAPFLAALCKRREPPELSAAEPVHRERPEASSSGTADEPAIAEIALMADDRCSLLATHCNDAIDLVPMMEALVAGQDLGSRLRLRALSRPVIAGVRRPLQGAVREVLGDALVNCKDREVQVVIGEVGVHAFIEVCAEGSTRDAPSIGMLIAGAVIEAQGGGLRMLHDDARTMLVHLPLAATD
jgi:hypothetical protein